MNRFLLLTALACGVVQASEADATADRLLRELSRVELRLRVPAVRIIDSPLTGQPEVLHAPRGALTPPAPDLSAGEVALGFLRQNAGIWGLLPRDVDGFEVIGESAGWGGLHRVRIRRPVPWPDLLALVDADGRLLRIQTTQKLRQ